MAKNLIREDVVYNGSHKAILPQHQRKDGEFAVTGENNPLPIMMVGSYVRKSTDTRPKGKEGDSLLLWDTKKVFVHDGTDWREL